MIVVDALQVPAEFSGVGRRALSIGRGLSGLTELPPLEVRCAADVRALLEPAFPRGTRFRTPIPRSRPRLRRIAYQQLIEPARDPASALVVCLGDQGPLWGRARVLLVVHDVRRLTHPGTSGRVESAFYRFLVPRAARHAGAVVTVSEFSRTELRRVLGPDVPVRVVADHPRPQVSEPLASNADGAFLVVGALRAYKGIETAVEALALLGSRRELLLAGTDEGRGEAVSRHAAERAVGGAVRLLGWVDDGRLARLRAGCLATVNPSTYEGYGLSVAESLSCGVPTIASDIPPHREVAGGAALYFEPGDAAGLAECMSRVVEDAALRSELAGRALERARELEHLGPSWADVILDAAREYASADAGAELA